MHEAVATEFPFVGSLPRAEKSRLAKLWDHFQDVRAAAAVHGVLLPQHYAATLLGVSKQRVNFLVKEGRLESVDLGGHPYVTEKSMLDYAKAERKVGRPVTVPGVREIFSKSLDSARETASKIS